MAVVQPTAVAPIQPLAGELPCAAGAAVRKEKKNDSDGVQSYATITF